MTADDRPVKVTLTRRLAWWLFWALWAWVMAMAAAFLWSRVADDPELGHAALVLIGYGGLVVFKWWVIAIGISWAMHSFKRWWKE